MVITANDPAKITTRQSSWKAVWDDPIEKTIMGALSLMAGLGCAAAISAVLPRLLVSEPAMLSSIGSSQTAFQLDWRVVIFAGSLAVITMLLLALVPLAQFARPELLPVLQNGSVNPTAARNSIA